MLNLGLFVDLPVPLAELEWIGLAVSEGREVIDPPLSEPGGGVDSVGGVGHPGRRQGQGHGQGQSDVMDTIQYTLQKQLPSLSQLYIPHNCHYSSYKAYTIV